MMWDLGVTCRIMELSNLKGPLKAYLKGSIGYYQG